MRLGTDSFCLLGIIMTKQDVMNCIKSSALIQNVVDKYGPEYMMDVHDGCTQDLISWVRDGWGLWDLIDSSGLNAKLDIYWVEADTLYVGIDIPSLMVRHPDMGLNQFRALVVERFGQVGIIVEPEELNIYEETIVGC